MKKIIPLLLCLATTLSAAPHEDIDQLAVNTDNLWSNGGAAQDGAFTSLGLSMLGWGVGLAAGIGILAGVLHQSTASHSHDCD